MKRVKVFLRGSLRKIHAEPIEVEVNTVAEAIEAVCGQLEGFKPDANGHKRVKIKDHPTEASLYEPISVDEIHIFPQLNGGKNGGWTQIIVSAVLITAAFFIAGPAGMAAAGSAMAAGTATLAQFMAVSLFMVGISTGIGGLLTLLMPAPSMDTAKQDEASKYLGTPKTTVAIGTTIRVIYGFRRVGFHIIAVNVNARNYAP